MSTGSSSCRVVLCDDTRDFVRLLRLVLELDAGSSIEVVGEAYDGRQAISLCERLQPDVLVLDISMPEMDGLTALPLIASASPDTRIIVLSGFSTREMKRLALEHGAVEFIEKGVAPLSLPGIIAAQC